MENMKGNLAFFGCLDPRSSLCQAGLGVSVLWVTEGDVQFLWGKNLPVRREVV